MRPPGYWLRAIAAWFCGRDTMERLVDPIVADLQVEYAALGEGNGWRRRRLLLSTYAGFWKALILLAALSVVHQPPDETARLRRAMGASLVMLALLTAAITLAPLLDVPRWQGGWAFRSVLVLLLIPQALPLGIPAALCIGILYAMRARRLTRRDLHNVVIVGVLASCVAWGVMNWGIPHANQSFRELMIAALSGREVHLEPGLNELGFSELGKRTNPMAIRRYHLWWALSFASLPLSVLALSISRRIRSALAAVTLATATLVVYYAALRVSDGYLSQGIGVPILVAWAPNALFLAAALGLMPRWRREAAI